jgi:hypothetical protein
MKLVVLGDIHGNIENVKYISLLLREIDFEYIFLVGDIGFDYNISDDHERILSSYYNDAIFKSLKIFNKPLFFIPGNHDHSNFDEYVKLKGLINVDFLSKEKVFKNKKLNILGIGGSPKTPGKWTYEWDDIDIDINDKYKYDSSLFNILLTHSPPFGSDIDINLFNKHCGSKRIRNLIIKQKFDLLLCGHIHEGQGIDYVNGLLCLNAGKVGMQANQPNLNFSSFFVIDNSIDMTCISRYIICFDSESGYFEYKSQDLKL